MNRLSLVRITLALALIALVAGCKSSSKARSTAKTEPPAARPVDVTSTVNVEPVPIAVSAPKPIAVRSTEKAEPFPPNPTPGPADAELSFRTHKVKKGDTFYGIAKQYGVNAKDVINANPGVEPTRIIIGQEIIVPFAKK